MLKQIVFAMMAVAAMVLLAVPVDAAGATLATNTCPQGSNPALRPWHIFVNGAASGSGWSWCINGPNYSVCDSNVSGPPPGSGQAAIVQAIVASINASGCPGVVAAASSDSSFRIGSSCVRGFEFCIGPANSTPQCCLNDLEANSCQVDATFDQPYFYECFPCGDANNDSYFTISDAVWRLSYIFSGGPAPARCKANASGDCSLSISDVVFIINHIFGSGPAPSNCW